MAPTLALESRALLKLNAVLPVELPLADVPVRIHLNQPFGNSTIEADGPLALPKTFADATTVPVSKSNPALRPEPLPLSAA